MTTEEAIIELMSDYRDRPEVAEAAYLVVQELNSNAIVENLDIRYDTGQGYARFKDDLEEMTGFEVDVSSGLNLVMEDQERSLDRIKAEDVGASLAGRIRNAFLVEVEPELRERLQSNITELSETEKLLAGVARSGYDADLWGWDPNDTTVWELFAILTGEPQTDKQKQRLVRNLVEAGCFYSQYTNSILLTPMLTNLENPYRLLPNIEKSQPEGH